MGSGLHLPSILKTSFSIILEGLDKGAIGK